MSNLSFPELTGSSSRSSSSCSYITADEHNSATSQASGQYDHFSPEAAASLRRFAEISSPVFGCSIRRASSMCALPTTPSLGETSYQGPHLITSSSVQFGERNVNWARPLRASDPDVSLPSAHLLGTSLQKNRRLQRSPVSQTESLPVSQTNTPSACSSASTDEYPSTPPSYAPAIPSRTWSLPPSAVKGLGFDLESDWMDSATDSTLASYLLPSPGSSGSVTPTPRKMYSRSRMISSSDSMTELSSPKTLAELRHLRQAARDLEMELKATTRSSYTPQTASFPSPSSSPVTMKARRIKRKAVPSLDLTNTTIQSRSTPPAASANSIFQKPMQPLSPVAQPLEMVDSAPRTHIRTASSPPATPKKSFYKNVIATQSLLNISPRSSSLYKFASSPPPSPAPSASAPPSGVSPAPSLRVRFRSHRREPSLSSSPSDTESSSISSFDDSPITPPTSSVERDGFASRLAGLGFSGSSINLGNYGIPDGMKGKKGLAKLFRRNATEV